MRHRTLGAPGRLALLVSPVLMVVAATIVFTAHPAMAQAVTTVRVTQPSQWPNDLITGGIGVAGVVIGTVLSGIKASAEARKRERFDIESEQRRKIAEYEDQLFNFADSIAVLYESLPSVAKKINAESRRKALGGRLLSAAGHSGVPQLVASSRALIEVTDQIFPAQGQAEVAEIISGDYASRFREILDLTAPYWTTEAARAA